MKSNLIISAKTALLAALGLVSLTSAQAQYAQGDLLAGFTTGSGNDLIADLGSASALTDGKTWNLASLLTGNLSTYANDTWGVIGVSAGSYVAASSTVYTTASGSNVGALVPIGKNQFKAAITDLGTLGLDFTTGTYAYDLASDGNSWNSQANGSTGFAADATNPNTKGVTAENFYAIQNSGITQNSYFSFSSAGVLSYHVASVTPPPTAGFTGSPTAGFAPLRVVFSNTSTGTITNWLWNFGDGHTATNTVTSSVTNIYAAAGKYTVSLVAAGPGGANTNTMANYITVAPIPQLGNITVSSGKLIFGGANGPSGVQYRILSSTNLTLPLASWTPVLTNTFSSNGTYSYTNSAATNAQTYFRLVSP